jgi:hypothetical protein
MKQIEEAGSELGTPKKNVVIKNCGIIEKRDWVDGNGRPEVPTADV